MEKYDDKRTLAANRIEQDWHPKLRKQLDWAAQEVLFYALSAAVLVGAGFHIFACGTDWSVLQAATACRRASASMVAFVLLGTALVLTINGCSTGVHQIEAAGALFGLIVVGNFLTGGPVRRP